MAHYLDKLPEIKKRLPVHQSNPVKTKRIILNRLYNRAENFENN